METKLPLACQANIGIVSFMAYPEISMGTGPVQASLSALSSDDYFSLIELTHIADPAVREQCQMMIAQANKIVAYGSHPTLLGNQLNLNHPDISERQKAINAIKKDIDEAYSWNAIGIVVLSGSDPGPDKREEGTRLLADSLNQLCDYSALNGEMPIVLEIFDRADFGKNCLMGPCEEVAQLAETVRQNHPSFGVLVDLSHIPLLNESAQRSLGTLKDYLVHAHIGNCVMKNPDHEVYGDNHPKFGIPDGENGLEELVAFLKVLKDIGYFKGSKKPLSFEIKPCRGETAESIIAESQEFLDKAWTLVY